MELGFDGKLRGNGESSCADGGDGEEAYVGVEVEEGRGICALLAEGSKLDLNGVARGVARGWEAVFFDRTHWTVHNDAGQVGIWLCTKRLKKWSRSRVCSLRADEQVAVEKLRNLL